MVVCREIRQERGSILGLPKAQRGQLHPPTESDRFVNRERKSFEESPFRGANRKGSLT